MTETIIANGLSGELAMLLPPIMMIFTVIYVGFWTLRLFSRDYYSRQMDKPPKKPVIIAHDHRMVLSAGSTCELCHKATTPGQMHLCTWVENGE